MARESYTLDLRATDSTGYPPVQLRSGSDLTFVPPAASRRMAPVTSPEQAYYWTRSWQANERAALADLAEGRSQTFDNADDAVRYLLQADH